LSGAPRPIAAIDFVSSNQENGVEISGSERIEAPREVVWRALNDPVVLKTVIPGCETIESLSATEMRARVTLRVGPVKATFQGQVTLADLDPPNAYTISGQGSGGAAGFAKGSARVKLEADGAATLLHYTVTAEIGGKLAQLGSRLIEGTARKLSADFFTAFGAAVSTPAAAIARDEGATAETRAKSLATQGIRGRRWLLWAALVLALAGLAYLVMR
jgi:carbon monoxide dehydrogenase subunit G